MLANVPRSERYAEQTVEKRYRVQRGDTVSKIAQRFRVKESELVSLNGLRSRHHIRVGQVLEIPGRGGGVAARAPSRTARSAPEPAPSDGVYRVQKGDSLGKIAARFGVSERDLQAKNEIRNRNQIQPGQVLQIPGGARTASPDARPGSGGVYTVRQGDTLHSIAKRMGATEAELIERNGLKSRHRIRVGQKLYLPGSPGAAQASPAPSPQVAKAPAPAAPPEASPAAAPARPAEESAAPAPPPAQQAQLPLAPERYAVDAKGRIEVQPDETLGHYAEWLDTSASGLQDRNGLPAGRPLPLGRRVALDFSRVGQADFEQRRLAHHRAIQQRFFSAYEVDGATDYVLRSGDTLWKLSRGERAVPVWLLRDYNPGLDLAVLRAGQRLKIPKVKPRG